MLVHTAHLTCRPESVEPFWARLERHARTTLEAEPGCLRFDLHQDRDEPTRFLLVEHYADDAALETHREAAHYKAFRADVANWLVKREWWFWTPFSAST